ncbi:ADP-ribosylglycohydrolase family protein [archaeon]|nr:MAG: ADP-ribosylglycohydrolase family protein [archaeon]
MRFFLLIGALVVALHIILHSSNFSDAIDLNIRAGGDSCSRALVIGAVFGAMPGTSIPEHWLSSVNGDIWKVVSSAADKIAADNTYLG